VDEYKKLGLLFLEKALQIAQGQAIASTPDGQKVIANTKQAIAELKQEAAKPKVPAAPATSKPSPDKPTPLMKNATGNVPQPHSASNPHGLSINLQTIWKKAFDKITENWFHDYKHIPGSYAGILKKQGKHDESRMSSLLQAAHKNKFSEGLRKLFDQVKVNDKNSHLSEAQLKALPSSIRSLVDKFGQAKLKKMLLAVQDFSGNDYAWIRNAFQGQAPRGEATGLTKEELEKKIKRYKAKADLIQELLQASPVRPAVPKFRGVPVSPAKLKELIQSASTGGSFVEKAMNSWSTSLSTAHNFASPKGGASERVIFRTLNRLGSSITSISSHSHENEILTPGNARYKVVGHTEQEIDAYGGKKRKIHFFDVVEY
jgi:hypothetical protein